MHRFQRRGRMSVRRGFVQLWFALMALMLLGFLGLAVDAGYMVHTGNQLQSAAEAAALAGAQEIWQGSTAARDAAVAMGPNNRAAGVAIGVDRNEANAADGDLVLGYWNEGDHTFDPAGAPLNACKVVARRSAVRNGQITLWFGSIFGVPSMDIERSAVAVSAGMGEGPAFVVLDNGTTTNALDLSGRISVDVTGGPVYVNSHAAQAARLVGSATIHYEIMQVCGGYSGAFTPTPRTNAPEISDPLGSLPEPSVAGRPVFYAPLGQPAPGEVQDLQPGYYPDGFNVKGTVNLAQGVYCIGNFSTQRDALSVNSSGVINGTAGVMLYIRGGIGLTSANTNLNLVPPDPTVNSFPEAELYDDIAVFQTRDRTQGVWPVVMPLSGTVTFRGTFYYPYGRVNVTASGSNDLGRMICWQFNGAGSGTVIVHWSGYQFPIPGPTYLVQ
jgi:hypothetical protein